MVKWQIQYLVSETDETKALLIDKKIWEKGETDKTSTNVCFGDQELIETVISADMEIFQ